MTDPSEQERARLSRELHDDIVQRIALVSAGLGALRHRLSDAPVEVQQQAASVATEIAGIGADLHRIARGLHPAVLERLGLEATVVRYCTELAHARRLTIDVHMADVPATLRPDAALCIYRVLQEALNNVVKHSGAGHATVSLKPSRGELVLRIVDAGVGFEADAVARKDALGLMSMRERARLAEAQLLVSSTPGSGTVIELHVPVGHDGVAVSA